MGFEKPLQELNLGEILRQTFNLYFSKFFLFFLPFIFAGLVTGVWGEVVSSMFPIPTPPQATVSLDVLLSYFLSLFRIMVVMLFLSSLVSTIVGVIFGGIAVKVASDTLENRSTHFSETLKFTVSRLPSLLVSGIITGILIAVGTICFILPGIILAIMFALVVPAIVIEQVGALESLSRSRRLVRGRWLETFLLLLVIGIIVGVAAFIFVAISSVFGPVDWIVSSVLGALVSPISPIAMMLYYYSMVAREQPPPSPAPTAPTLLQL